MSWRYNTVKLFRKCPYSLGHQIRMGIKNTLRRAKTRKSFFNSAT